MSTRFDFARVIVLAAALAIVSGIANAQSAGAGCKLESVGKAQVLRCGNGLSVTPEKGAEYTLNDRNGDDAVDSLDLKVKGVLLDLPPGAAEGFEVVAPQAIAAVRGTRWVVDAASGKTSVFVIRGSVAVSHSSRQGTVTLDPGDGVDVEKDTGPLVVKRWPKKRVSALLARFGQ